jgi:hypothetical protein
VLSPAYQTSCQGNWQKLRAYVSPAGPWLHEASPVGRILAAPWHLTTRDRFLVPQPFFFFFQESIDFLHPFHRR